AQPPARRSSSFPTRRHPTPTLFPTRRSSDLDMDPANSVVENGNTVWQTYQIRTDRDEAYFGEVSYDINDSWTVTAGVRHFEYDRSEEHTSELQSRENLVCRLLLEKKKHEESN